MDFRPGDLPDKIPPFVYVWWDSCGEYMDTTHDLTEGEGWMEQAARGCGYAAKYRLSRTAGD